MSVASSECTVVGSSPATAREANTNWFGYSVRAVANPYNTVAVLSTIAAGVVFMSALVNAACLLLLQVLVLAVVPQLRAFRRHVDDRIARVRHQAAVAAAAAERAGWLERMDISHRSELQQLERLIDRIREAERAHECAAAGLFIDECVRLTAVYVQLAVARKAMCDCVATTNRNDVQTEVTALTASTDQDDRVRAAVRRRLDVARRRLAQLQRLRDDIDRTAHELAIVSSLVRLQHDSFVSFVQVGAAHCDVDALTADVEEHERQSNEIIEVLGLSERLVDPAVLDLGRSHAS